MKPAWAQIAGTTLNRLGFLVIASENPIELGSRVTGVGIGTDSAIDQPVVISEPSTEAEWLAQLQVQHQVLTELGFPDEMERRKNFWPACASGPVCYYKVTTD